MPDVIPTSEKDLLFFLVGASREVGVLIEVTGLGARSGSWSAAGRGRAFRPRARQRPKRIPIWLVRAGGLFAARRSASRRGVAVSDAWGISDVVLLRTGVGMVHDSAGGITPGCT